MTLKDWKKLNNNVWESIDRKRVIMIRNDYFSQKYKYYVHVKKNVIHRRGRQIEGDNARPDKSFKTREGGLKFIKEYMRKH